MTEQPSPPRGGSRVAHRLPVDIELSGGERATGTSRNISLGGMFLETTLTLQEGDRITLRFSVPAQKDAIVAEAEVRWREAAGVGVRFLGLRAADTWALGKLLATPPAQGHR